MPDLSNVSSTLSVLSLPPARAAATLVSTSDEPRENRMSSGTVDRASVSPVYHNYNGKQLT